MQGCRPTTAVTLPGCSTWWGVDGAGQRTHGGCLAAGSLVPRRREGENLQVLLQQDLIETVIDLAPNLFYGAGLAACILVLRKRKEVKRQQQVFIVDASELYRRGRAQNYLDNEHATDILRWVQGYEDVKDRARVVDLDEIEEEDWTLNISRYVLPPIGEDIPPSDEAIADFKVALNDAREAEGRLCELMNKGGWQEE